MYEGEYLQLGHLLWMELIFVERLLNTIKSALINKYLLLFIGILLCLLALSIPIDAAKKKLLKKLAKELGYKLEEAIEQVLKFII